jgi:hypothetical protein
MRRDAETALETLRQDPFAEDVDDMIQRMMSSHALLTVQNTFTEGHRWTYLYIYADTGIVEAVEFVVPASLNSGTLRRKVLGVASGSISAG